MEVSLLSIVLIARKNTSLQFRRALESAMNQTYPHKEIVVVNANDSDSPYGFGLYEDLVQYPEVLLLQPHEDGTDAFYRNYALGKINGDYIAYMSGADAWEPTKAAWQIEQLKSNTDAAASCCNGTILYEQTGSRHQRGITSETFYSEITYDARRWVLDNPVRAASQVVYQTEILRETKGFDEHFECLCDLDKVIGLAGENRVLFFPLALFETHAGINDDYTLRRNCFEDGRRLMHNHAELFLLNRKLAYRYYKLMAKQAKDDHFWFQMVFCFILSFFKAPVFALKSFILSAAHITAKIIKQCFWQGIAASGTAKLRRSLWQRKIKRTQDKLIRGQSDLRHEAQTMLADIPAKEFSQYRPFKYAGSRRLEYVTLPEHVTVVRRGMFCNCGRLISVVIPSTVTKIEAYAFLNCPNLKNVVFQPGSNLAHIGKYAFAGCVSLTAIRLPSNLEWIGKGAFAGCASLRRFEFSYLSADGEIAKLILPSSLDVIPKFAFAGCASLGSVVFDDGSVLEKIEKAAFLNCLSLETLEITGHVSRINAYAFSGCSSLINFGMPQIDAVKKIGKSAFAYCSGLQEVTVPYASRKVSARAYYGCTGLRSVVIPKGVQIVGRQAFGQCASLKNAMLTNPATVFSPSAFPKETLIDVYNSRTKTRQVVHWRKYMAVPSQLKRNYVYHIIYRLSICILPLIVTPYAARVLGVAGNGIYAFSSTVACYFIMFGKLGLDNYGNRSIAYCRDDPEQRSRTFWSIYIVQLCTSVVAIGLYAGFVGIFFRDQLPIYRMQFLYVLSVLFDVSWFFYGMEKFRLATIRSLISRAILVAGVYLFVYTESDLQVFTFVMSACFLLEQLMLIPFIFKYVKFTHVTYKEILSHIRPNLKLFIPLLALSVYNWMDKIMLGVMVNMDSVAFYSYAENIINLPKGILTALGTVMLPSLAYMAANNRSQDVSDSFSRSMVFNSLVCCALCFGIAGVAPVFVPWFFGPAYNQTILLTIELAIVMIPMSISNLVQMQYLIPFKLEHIYIKAVILGAAVNLFLNIALIPPLKASGAVIATIAAELAVCVYQMIRIRKIYTIRQLFGALVPFVIFGFIEFGVVFGMRGIDLQPLPLILLQIAAGGGVYVVCCLLYFVIFRKGYGLIADIVKNRSSK